MPLIAETLVHANAFRKQFGLPQNDSWAEKADGVLVSRENGVTLEFTSMNGSAVVKQADVILVTFPLSYTNNYTSQDALNDLDYVSLLRSISMTGFILIMETSTQTSSQLTVQL